MHHMPFDRLSDLVYIVVLSVLWVSNSMYIIGITWRLRGPGAHPLGHQTFANFDGADL